MKRPLKIPVSLIYEASIHSSGNAPDLWVRATALKYGYMLGAYIWTEEIGRFNKVYRKNYRTVTNNVIDHFVAASLVSFLRRRNSLVPVSGESKNVDCVWFTRLLFLSTLSVAECCNSYKFLLYATWSKGFVRYYWQNILTGGLPVNTNDGVVSSSVCASSSFRSHPAVSTPFREYSVPRFPNMGLVNCPPPTV